MPRSAGKGGLMVAVLKSKNMIKKYDIKGMHCRSCEILIEKNISHIPGVNKVNVNHKKGYAQVEFFSDSAPDAQVEKAVQEAGYSLGESARLPWLARDNATWSEILFGATILMLLFMAGELTGLFNGFGLKFSAAPTYPIIFVIGLTAGISTCMAVVGGLVAGFSAAYAESNPGAGGWAKLKPNLMFNAGRIISFAVLGGIIGAIGSAVKISSGLTDLIVLLAGTVMIYLGIKLSGISPRLSSFSIALPKSIGKKIGLKESAERYTHGSAFAGGILTFFLPCGFTQAMQIYAITTGSFASGSLIMLIFALGTTPGLLGIGALISALKGKVARIFFRLIGLAVILLGLMSLANLVSASGFGLPSYFSPDQAGPKAINSAPIRDGEQLVYTEQLADGYQPGNAVIRKGIPVKWIVNSKESYTCASSIRMPAFGIAQSLRLGENIIRFTPDRTGTVRFTCGMGMYSGSFTVVE